MGRHCRGLERRLEETEGNTQGIRERAVNTRRAKKASTSNCDKAIRPEDFITMGVLVADDALNRNENSGESVPRRVPDRRR
jgi:hypothetical protein